jgi:hypothetical protein
VRGWSDGKERFVTSSESQAVKHILEQFREMAGAV